MHKTSGLAWRYLCRFDRFASLFPFFGWRDQGMGPGFVSSPAPPYWTGFDVVNLIGYAPLGFLLTLGLAAHGLDALWAVALATLAVSLLSLLHGFLQICLPWRVPSIWTWAQCCGHLAGRRWRRYLERLGAHRPLERLPGPLVCADARGAHGAAGAVAAGVAVPRRRCFVWLGQVLERLEAAFMNRPAGPFMDWMPCAGPCWSRCRPAVELAVRDAGLAGAQPAGRVRHPPCGAAGGVATGVLVIGVAVTAALSAAR